MPKGGNNFIPIDKGIPMPPPKRGGRRNFDKPTFPWAQMEVGDSVFVAGKSRADCDHAVRGAHQRQRSRFASREVEGGIRVWRVA